MLIWDLDITARAIQAEPLADLAGGETDATDQRAMVGTDGIQRIAFRAPPSHGAGGNRNADWRRQRDNGQLSRGAYDRAG